MLRRVKIRITGTVQGVFFRSAACQLAQKLNLMGYVCNESDNSVKIVAEGPQQALQKLIQWCYNGPDLAKVSSVEVTWQPVTGQLDHFEIKYK